jgi:hypothetical protein
MSSGTAIAVMPNRVNALRRDILSVTVALLSFRLAAISLLRDTLEELKALSEKWLAAHDNEGKPAFGSKVTSAFWNKADKG